MRMKLWKLSILIGQNKEKILKTGLILYPPEKVYKCDLKHWLQSEKITKKTEYQAERKIHWFPI